MNLIDHLDNFSPYEKRSIARQLITSFENLLIEYNIDLSQSHKFDAHKVITWGLPISFFSKESLSDQIFKEVIDSILENGEPDPDDFSEIQTLALLLALGTTSGEKVKRNNKRVHDFNVNWFDKFVEVETTKASTKTSHIERTQQANSITESLFSQSKNFDIHAYIPDLLEEPSKKNLLEAASNMKSGDVSSEEGIWQLESHDITRDIYKIYKFDTSRVKPEWWPKGVANLFTIKQMMAGPESKTAPPQVFCNFAVPITGYLNPVKKKVRRFQGSSNRPYLIVIDANNLSDPFNAFKEGLNYRLSKWLHVSGILLYQNYFSQNEMGWEWQLFNNPKAKRPLPGQLLEAYGIISQRMRLVKKEA